MRIERFRRGCVALLSVSLVSLGLQAPAAAGVVGTADAIALARQQNDLVVVRDALARADVRDQMLTLGVDPAEVEGRLGALTAPELATLAGNIREAPAGGDSALAIIGAVFLVLLILELTGTIDIFKKT
ncbi:MAG: PA2779 family protein [Gammaproteobacteria bacterium]|nr:PA2779 family protein [Gammaproteobacteria bacterium]